MGCNRYLDKSDSLVGFDDRAACSLRHLRAERNRRLAAGAVGKVTVVPARAPKRMEEGKGDESRGQKSGQ